MGQFTVIDTGVLVIYFLAMASLGPLFARKARTTEGYFLGDRAFPGWLIGFSMFATSISSVTFVAYPADAYKAAWFRMMPNLTLPVAVLIATIFFLPFFRRTQITSAYEYLEGRFGPWTRLYAAIAFIIMQVVRVSLILYLVAVLLQQMTGLSPVYSILIGGIITSFYTVLGGIRAVVWTDFIQAVVLWGGGLTALGVIVAHLDGGLADIFQIGMANEKFSMADFNPETRELEPLGWAPDFTEKTVTLVLLMGLGHWLLEYSANQNVIQRYAATRSARQAKVAMWTNCLFSVPTWALFMFLGTALYAFYQQFPTEEAQSMLTGETNPEHILPFFVISELAPGLTGLVIAAVLAAAMSSLSSSINAVSAVGLVDVYKRHVKPGAEDTHYVIVAKLIAAAMGGIMVVGAWFLQREQSNTLQDTATVLTALTAGGLLGIYLFGFFTKRGDDRALLIAIAVTVVFTLWTALSNLGLLPEAIASPIHNYYVGLLGHVLLFVLAFGLALLLPRKKNGLRNLTIYTQDDVPLD